MSDGEPLSGGGLTGAERVGATVHRETGPWTPAVHALLHHLEAAGFDAPRVLGIDYEGREVLTYVEGRAGIEPYPPRTWDDDTLAKVGRLIRAYHDATVDFVPPADARWQSLVGAPSEAEVVCHNDLSPANTIYADHGPRTFVDWDLAAPGTRIWDLSYAAYRFVPLYSDEACERLGIPMLPRGPRLRVLSAAYGFDDRRQLLDVVEARILSLYETARERGEAGEPGWRDVWRDTRGRQWLDSLENLRRHRAAWDR
jgi:aminoglycoside phosphotransferase (APT) family kinase protein